MTMHIAHLSHVLIILQMSELKPPVPNILMLVALFICTIGIIIAGYFHGKMHLLTVLKNAVS